MRISENLYELIEDVEGVQRIYLDYQYSAFNRTTGIVIIDPSVIGKIWLKIFGELEWLCEADFNEDDFIFTKKDIKEFAESLAGLRLNNLGRGYIIY